MPLFSAKILPAQGAVIDARVRAPGAGDGSPLESRPHRAVRLLIDTGCSHTSLRPDVVRSLGLSRRDHRTVATPTDHPSVCDVYVVRLELGSALAIDNVTTVETPLFGQDIDGLLGRDVLRHAMLVYHGPDESWTVAF